MAKIKIFERDIGSAKTTALAIKTKLGRTWVNQDLLVIPQLHLVFQDTGASLAYVYCTEEEWVTIRPVVHKFFQPSAICTFKLPELPAEEIINYETEIGIVCPFCNCKGCFYPVSGSNLLLWECSHCKEKLVARNAA